PLREGNAELAAEAAQCVDASRARGNPGGTRSMERLQRLLFDALHADGANVSAASGLEQGGWAGGVGFVAADIGSYVLGRDELSLNAQPLQPARPMVGRGTRLHH